MATVLSSMRNREAITAGSIALCCQRKYARKCGLFGFVLMSVGRAVMYSVTKALALTISGAVAVGGSDDGGGREGGEGMGEDDDDAEDGGSCGYKGAGSSIAILWKSSAREMQAFDRASVVVSSIGSDASSNDSTVWPFAKRIGKFSSA